jgi:lambda family phage portal protein
MNFIDKAIGAISPHRGLKRWKARKAFDVAAQYEATRPSRTRKNPADNRSGDAVAEYDIVTLRGQARHLEQNHDFAFGILTTLTNNVVGPRGITVEFMPKRIGSDEIDTVLSEKLGAAFKEWCHRPECTGQHSWAKTQRLMCRTWLRDGEVLLRHLEGVIPGLKHGSKVPYSVETFEPDFMPVDLNDATKRIVQGVEKNAWGQHSAYWLYDDHPGGNKFWKLNARRYSATSVEHLKFVQRMHQTRGASIFAPVMNRINDLKDYEENERVAAKIASTMVGFIQKGSPDSYEADETNEDGDRELNFQAGGIYDDLEPGETVGTLESNRPSALLTPFVETMQRMTATGTMASFSSISKNYNGTYSAQRQELVEQWSNYETLSLEFCEEIVEPVVRRWVKMMQLSGVVDLPLDIDLDSLLHIDFITPTMPWINPVHEAKADELLLENLLMSPQQSIRRRGRNPNEVLKQAAAWQEKVRKSQITAPPKRPAQQEGGEVTEAIMKLIEGMEDE